MIDEEKTNMLRDKLRKLPSEPNEKNDAANSVAKASKALASLTWHIAQIFFFWGAQIIILDRVGVAPLGFWESLVVFEAAIIFLKR